MNTDRMSALINLAGALRTDGSLLGAVDGAAVGGSCSRRVVR